MAACMLFAEFWSPIYFQCMYKILNTTHKILIKYLRYYLDTSIRHTSQHRWFHKNTISRRQSSLLRTPRTFLLNGVGPLLEIKSCKPIEWMKINLPQKKIDMFTRDNYFNNTFLLFPITTSGRVPYCFCSSVCGYVGVTEIAGVDNVARSNMQWWKTRERTSRLPRRSRDGQRRSECS